jgi:hypothetical protein
MGIDTYVSRAQLPGAAPSRRLVRTGAGADASRAGPRPQMPPRSTPQAGGEDGPAAASPVASPRVSRQVAADVEAAPLPAAPQTADPARFSLAAIVAGGVLWLEELQQGILSRDQVQLVAAMANAVAPSPQGGGRKPEVTQFNWPMHNNAQFDQSEAAGRAALSGFVARRLGESGCRALVLLGESSARRLPADTLPDVPRVRAPSTLEMLATPDLKKAAWGVLRDIAGER